MSRLTVFTITLMLILRFSAIPQDRLSDHITLGEVKNLLEKVDNRNIEVTYDDFEDALTISTPEWFGAGFLGHGISIAPMVTINARRIYTYLLVRYIDSNTWMGMYVEATLVIRADDQTFDLPVVSADYSYDQYAVYELAYFSCDLETLFTIAMSKVIKGRASGSEGYLDLEDLDDFQDHLKSVWIEEVVPIINASPKEVVQDSNTSSELTDPDFPFDYRGQSVQIIRVHEDRSITVRFRDGKEIQIWHWEVSHGDGVPAINQRMDELKEEQMDE